MVQPLRRFFFIKRNYFTKTLGDHSVDGPTIRKKHTQKKTSLTVRKSDGTEKLTGG